MRTGPRRHLLIPWRWGYPPNGISRVLSVAWFPYWYAKMLVRTLGFELRTCDHKKMVCEKFEQNNWFELKISAHARHSIPLNRYPDEFDTEIWTLYTNVTPLMLYITSKIWRESKSCGSQHSPWRTDGCFSKIENPFGSMKSHWTFPSLWKLRNLK